ncbi:phosphatase PAP2 family protein [Pseudactinotalea sp. Z1739]|uniref:phosphatase PAP2 family protein n=1 Tax=Pseudactinotalea sp. Z1739 TaxID=3413028 RepID=UPI003C7E7C0D
MDGFDHGGRPAIDQEGNRKIRHGDLGEVRLTGARSRLSAAAGLTVGAVLLVLATTTVGLVFVPGPGVGLDLTLLSRWSSSGPGTITAAGVLSGLADRSVSVALTVVVVGVLWWRTRRPDLPAVALLALAGGAVLMAVTKLLVDRPRPGEAAETATFSAFPSGHATRAMVLGLLLAWLLVRWRRSWRRFLLAAGVLALAVGVGLTRVVLAMHWPTDVVGGWMLGAAWFAVVLLVLRPACTGPPRAGRHPAAAG